jgi:hypothetical protein
MPTPALQVIAGYAQGERYLLPRGHVEPPESLKRMLFPFIQSEMENIQSTVDIGTRKPGLQPCARYNWLVFCSLIVQDTAAMCLKHPSQKNHTFFKLPIFQ